MEISHIPGHAGKARIMKQFQAHPTRDKPYDIPPFGGRVLQQPAYPGLHA
jgi:hypothetical protein